MTKCFVWIPQGRLGNLIFQYQAVSRLSAGGVVLAADSDFFDLFEKPRRFLVIPCFKRLRGHLQMYWTKFFQSLADKHLLGTIKPGVRLVLGEFPAETSEIHWNEGRLRSVFLVKGFFQSPRYISPLPRMKPEILSIAEGRIADIPRRNRVAVHMRFGDYNQWAMLGVPGSACLPAAYYLNALAMIMHSVPAAHFLVLSDEPAAARAVLEPARISEQIRFVEGGTPGGDFALIASCSHAVVSASSYSWWAATLIANPDRILVAPKYWLGFARKVWFPPDVESSHFTYIDALPD